MSPKLPSDDPVDSASQELHLIGFKHSVYTWIVRLTLEKLGLEASYIEANPFADPPDPVLAKYTPLRRVPVLEHGAFRLTETAAISGYLNDFATGALRPAGSRAQSRMAQVIGLVDADVYPILVRQVFSPGYYAPKVLGLERDAEAIARGLNRSKPVLSVLDGIAAERLQLGGDTRSLADLHLAPMISYAARVPEAETLLATYPALWAWWCGMREDDALQRTDPLADHLPV